MTIYKAYAYNTENKKTVDMGRIASKGKMDVLSLMRAHSDELIKMFRDCGEFQLIWNTKAKCWEFFHEGGELVGRVSVDVDNAANYAAKQKMYREHKNAYEAQLRMNGCR